MANIFPSWTNALPIKILIAVMILGTSVSLGMYYYFTPKYTRVGYAPTQPVDFEHSLHAGQLGIDCRYCHVAVESSMNSTVPTAETCMRCHKQIKKDSPRLAQVRESFKTGQPIEWVKVHQVPDYVYFDHSAHVNRGVSCVSCHGQVNEMKVVTHMKPMSMAWCLECHRAPEKNLRPVDEVFNLNWKPAEGESQEEKGKIFKHDWKINPPLTCEGCHR